MSPLLGKRGPGTFNIVQKLLICLAMSIKTKISPKANVIPNIFEINPLCSIYLGTVQCTFVISFGSWDIVCRTDSTNHFLSSVHADYICKFTSPKLI